VTLKTFISSRRQLCHLGIENRGGMPEERLDHFLVWATEFIGLKRKMEAMMLTVFKANIGEHILLEMRSYMCTISPDSENSEGRMCHNVSYFLRRTS
jgi:hypothetical protein